MDIVEEVRKHVIKRYQERGDAEVWICIRLMLNMLLSMQKH